MAFKKLMNACSLWSVARFESSKPRKIKGCRTIVDSPRLLNGRSGGIRTRDPLHPMQVRYQAALHPE